MKKNKIGYSQRTRKKIRWVIVFLIFYFFGATVCGYGYLSLVKKEKIQIKILNTIAPYSDALASNFRKSKKS